MSAPVRFEAVSFRFPGQPVELLRDLSFTAEAGGLTAIVGASGCGKSTLLRLAAGLLSPTQGTVRVGMELPEAAERAFVFQKPTLLPWRTVEENVCLPLELSDHKNGADGEAVSAALEQVGLAEVAQALPNSLSGGMAMRASLARALVTRPELMLLDEPFSSLDRITRARVVEVFVALRAEHPFTAMMVTHDIEEAVCLADRVLVVGGSPLEVRATVEVPFNHPRTPQLRHDPEMVALCRRLEALL